MNESTLKNLKVVVERAVRPVRASADRKRRMREELLAHLSAIFEEEVEKVGHEQGALDRARQRFGDPSELTGQLQETVPRWDRVSTFFEGFDLQPGESLLHLAGKYVLTMLAGYAILMPGGVLSLLIRGRQYEIPVALWSVLVVFVASTLLYVPLLIMPYKIGRVLYGNDAERSWRKAAWYGLASLAFLPAMAFGTYWAGTFDLAASLIHLRFACLFAPAAPVVFFAMARLVFDDMHYKEEWASLEIDS